MALSAGSERAIPLPVIEPGLRTTSRAARLWRLACRNPLGSVSLACLILIALVAIFAPWLSPYDPERSITGAALHPPSALHWLGTDNLGRDILSRILYGSRISLLIAISVSILGTVPAIFIGLLSGYCAGNVDLVIQRFVDSLSAFPGLILALLFMVVFGQSVGNVIISLSLVNSPRIIRTLRSVVLSVKERDYILASRTMGARGARVMLLHVLPNCMAPVIILVSASFGAVIIIESSLDFLGLGIPPNVPTWGSMLGGDAQKYVQTAPWMAVFPGLFLSATVLAMNLLGDTLRDILDPRLRAG
ncbi:MAG TPA: ABC transporter permease [Dehalococcoidia bacterium]|nr:ABC transporter permease [Dehalococcoidia bacterium]